MAAAFAHYIDECESAEPGASSGGVVTPSRIIGKLLAAAPGRSVGLMQICLKPEAERVC